MIRRKLKIQYLASLLPKIRSRGFCTLCSDSIRFLKLPMSSAIILGEVGFLSMRVELIGRDDLIVEIDVILPRSSTLHYAHDVGETIQCMLERYVRSLHLLSEHACLQHSLDGVIRAYVHTDYSSYNPPQHTSRKQRTSSTNGAKLALTPSRLSENTDDASTGSITPTNSKQ
jgi:hypothetical protein